MATDGSIDRTDDGTVARTDAAGWRRHPRRGAGDDDARADPVRDSRRGLPEDGADPDGQAGRTRGGHGRSLRPVRALRADGQGQDPASPASRAKCGGTSNCPACSCGSWAWTLTPTSAIVQQARWAASRRFVRERPPERSERAHPAAPKPVPLKLLTTLLSALYQGPEGDRRPLT